MKTLEKKNEPNKTTGTYIDPEVPARLAYFIDNVIKESQQKVSEKVGITQGYISLMLSGKRGLGFNTLNKFVKVYGLNVKWLAGDPDEEPIAPHSIESPSLLGQGMKGLVKEIERLNIAVKSMEKANVVMRANQEFFIKRIEQLVEQLQKK